MKSLFALAELDDDDEETIAEEIAEASLRL